MKWVVAKKMADLSGLTEKALEHMRRSGRLIEGTHWKRAIGRVWFCVPAIESLIEQWRDIA